LQLPGDDRVVSASASRDLATRLGGDTEVIEYEDAYHDLYRDPAAAAAAADLARWIARILEDRGGAGAGTAL
ncbi:MAG: lysophospholipase, partial [Gemmatimonadetes bacterium]|nr:lysophospholipase [Gemmatimonadota bacterium]